MASILDPMTIRGKELKNRIVVGPAERIGYRYDDGVMSEELVREYATIAENDAGLIIGQACVLSERDRAVADVPLPGIYKAEHAVPIGRIAEAAHENGAIFIVQLGSALDYTPDWSTEDLEAFRSRYIRGARLCLEAGADGVEIHGAHGYALNQIVSPLTNGRSDKYRDGLDFLREIVEGIRALPGGAGKGDDASASECGVSGADAILSYRMGCCFDWDKDIEMAKAIEAMGFDILNVSKGIREGHVVSLREEEERSSGAVSSDYAAGEAKTRGALALGIPVGYEFSDEVFAASVLKKHLRIPVVAAWGIETLRRGKKIVEGGEADLVAYAKSFLADPTFASKGVRNLDYASCLGCLKCAWYTDGAKCPGRRGAKILA